MSELFDGFELDVTKMTIFSISLVRRKKYEIFA